MKSKPLFVKLFISLTFILIIPVIIVNTISNYTILHYSENEISKNSIGKLKVAVSTSRQIADAVSKDAIRLSVNNIINQLGSAEEFEININRGDNMIKAGHVMDTLIELVRTNSGYHSVYLYLEDLGYTFTTNNGFVSNEELNDKGWINHYKDSMENKTPLSWMKARIPDDSIYNKTSTSAEHVITYIYPLTPYTTNLKGAIVINIKWDFFNKLINNSNPESEGYINIINTDGDVVSSIDKDFLDKNIYNEEYIKSIIDSTHKEGYLVTKINSKKSLISYYKSEFNNWIYVGNFSLETLTKRVSSTRWNTIYISLLVVALGIFISFLISNKLYSPVKKLVQKIKSEKGIEFTGSDDEMLIIDRAFNNILRQEKQLFNVLEENKKSLRKTVLINLLKGSPYTEVSKGMVETTFIYPNYLCIIITIDNYKEFKKSFDTNQQYYMKELILKISEETLNASYKCESLNMEERECALIINTDETDICRIQDNLEKVLIKIKSEVAKVLDYSISIGVGGLHLNREEIKDSYVEAREALKNKLKKGHGSIIFCSTDFYDQKYFYPFDVEKHIINYLDLEDNNRISDVIEKLVDNIKAKDDLSCDNVMQIFNQLVGNTIIKYLVDSRININDIFGSGFNIYLELSMKETLEDIKIWIINIYETIINYCTEMENQDKDKFSKILDYIHRNYKLDIGISNIAEYVGLSYSHVRKIFKDETGENIVDYINSLRINEAKKMLTDTDTCIKEIALNVGYNNDQSFTRFFKKFEGITPGEYRSKLSVIL